MPKITALIALGLTGLVQLAAAADGGDKVAVCAGCHGPNGHSAVPENPILAGQSAQYLAIALQQYLSGERDYRIMKTMAERMSDEDTREVIAYYAAQPPARSQAGAAGDPARGEGLAAKCAVCHGPGGQSAVPIYPSLAGQHAVYLRNAMQAYLSGSRTNNIMLAMMNVGLSEQDFEDLAAYYSMQPVRPQQVQGASQ